MDEGERRTGKKKCGEKSRRREGQGGGGSVHRQHSGTQHYRACNKRREAVSRTCL